MIVGSVLCTAAVNWPMLLLGRGFQGVGAAGIMNLVMIILADSVSLKEQAKTVSIFQLVNVRPAPFRAFGVPSKVIKG